MTAYGMKETFQFVEWQLKGKTLRGSLHSTGSKEQPYVVFCHGFTSQRMGPEYLFVKFSRTLAQQGIASLRFDFRGCGESDGRFSDMTLSTMKEDLFSAIRFIKQHDPKASLFVLGHSLGGAVAALGAAETKARGLILLAPVAQPHKIFMERKQNVVAAGVNQNGFYEKGPHEMGMHFIEDMKNQNPLEALAGFKGDLIIFQGDADPSVSVRESGKYTHYARQQGINEEYHLLPNNDHNFSTVAGVNFISISLSAWIRKRCSCE
ncbi:MAG: alpha/beta fold hydrolase [Chitinivibrionales bacterium]|nr:alpha/beta fold hydrolase [Chitinivibrionales bacterium]